jgi:hypothetical protein
MTGRSRAVLFAIAAALLVTGLFGPVRRAFEDRQRADAAREISAQVEREREAAKAALQADRAAIVAGIRERLDARDNAEALKRASKYLPAGDAEIRSMFNQAASAESRRQSIEAYKSLIARECTEATARERIAAMINDATGAPTRAGGVLGMTLARITGTPAQELVRARMAEPRPKDEAHDHGPADGKASDAATRARAAGALADDDWIARMREANRARGLPEIAEAIQGARTDEFICVWHAEGTRLASGRERRFSVVAWLAPRFDGKSLGVDPVRYAER